MPIKISLSRGAGPALIAALVLASAPALAGGSIPLSKVLAAAKNAKGLEEAVSKQLGDSKAGSADDIVCSATRVGRHFDNLGGERVAPYECEIGGRVLDVDAKVRLLDAEGNELELGDPETPAKAAKIEEEEFQWQWRDAAPE